MRSQQARKSASSKATSATRNCCADIVAGLRHRLPPGRAAHHPLRRRAARGDRGDGRGDLRSARAVPEVERPQDRHGLLGLGLRHGRRLPDRRAAPPLQQPHLYGAAKAFSEGLLRSFNDMYGLDYVALRYFNVYGPRMDIHGRYTEVLVRWMERLEHGEAPPIIFGDGMQTMDMIHVATSRAPTSCGDFARITTSVQRRQRDRDVAARPRAPPRAASWADPTSCRSTGPSARSIRCRAGSPTPMPRAADRLRTTIPLRAGLGELVDWWRGERETCDRAKVGSSDPDRTASARRGGGRRRRGRHPLRLGDARPAGRRLRGGVRRSWPARPRLRRLQLHDGAAPRAARRRRRARRRGHHGQPLLHRHAPTPSATAAPCPVFVDIEPVTLQHRSRRDRGGHHPADAGDPCRPPDGHALRPRSRSCRSPARHGLPVIEDAACAIGCEILSGRQLATDRPAARRRRLLLASIRAR